LADRVIEIDVLVVGGGGAGFRAAIGARQRGAKVLLLSKGPLARCGATPMAGADLTLDGNSLNKLGFPGEPKDSKELMFGDIVTQGFYLNNQKLVEQYAENAPARLKELIDWGIDIRHSEERAIFTTGVGIMDALLGRAKQLGVDLLEDTMLLDLFSDAGRVTGGLGLDVRSGQFIEFRAKAVVMATGGWHKAFWPNTGMRDLSGEGMAAAQRAGASLGNMEFITFCCNVLLDPPHCRGSIATYVMSIWRPFVLTNSQGESFLDQYDPYTVDKGTAMEWNKAFISFASQRETRAGRGSPHGGVYYGLGDQAWDEFEAAVTQRWPKWKYKALDLSEIAERLRTKQPVEVGPAVEYFDGGIVVDERFRSSLAGLYAAGECTLGPFGANRIHAAITEMLVHGADAGEHAADYAGHIPHGAQDKATVKETEQRYLRPLGARSDLPPAVLRRQVQEAAHRHLGPIRHHDELNALIDFIATVKKDQLPNLGTREASRVYNKEWLDIIELENMVQLLEAAAKSALDRTESRGVHYREDYPDTDNDRWLQESIVTLQDGVQTVAKRPITITSLTPPQGAIAYLDMMKQMMEAHSATGGHH